MTTLLIVIAGTLGCVVRWTIEEVVERRVLRHRAYATMAVNIFGALLTGFVVYKGLHSNWTVSAFLHFQHHTEPILLTGFCGGFTTFSSALAIPYLDWQRGSRLRAAVLVGATPLLCVLSYLCGVGLAKF
jgi:CrcB protein